MIFIDTGAFLARYLERDQYRKEGAGLWQELNQTRPILFTSNFVLDETLHTFSTALELRLCSREG